MAAQRLQPGTLPRASTSTSTTPTNCSWTPVAGRSFCVRQGPAYHTHRQKAPSEATLYDVFAVDAYHTHTKVPHLGRLADLPPPPNPQFGLPSVVLVHLMLPSYAPSVMPSSGSDGEGWSVCLYCRLRRATIEALQQNRPTPGMELFRRFVHATTSAAASGDADLPLRRRLKCIARSVNPRECGFSGPTRALIHKYNAKPFMIRDTSSFYRAERYFEIDVDVHRFGMTARLGLYGVRSVLPEMVFDWAFVIEGEADSELPEQLLCCARLHKVDPRRLTTFPTTLPADTAPFTAPPFSDVPDEEEDEVDHLEAVGVSGNGSDARSDESDHRSEDGSKSPAELQGSSIEQQHASSSGQ